jgi:methionyl-tRNA synthetase
MTRRFLITCAPPNPNGDLHLGHLSGPFLGADVLSRYLTARGEDVSYVAYTDDHSVYVPRRGAELGLGAWPTAHRFTNRIEATLAQASLLPDFYSHPHRDPLHDRFVQEHFQRLWDSGVIVEKELPTPFCVTCDRFLYEAYLRGRCRFCAAPSDGTYCEECGYPQDPGGLAEPRCVVCGSPPQLRPDRRLVVELAPFTEQLGELFTKSPWRQRVLDYVTELIANGLPDVPISRRTDYGVPVPLEAWSGHVLDTWFSGIFGYVAATAGYGAALGRPEHWRDLWQDQDTVLIHFIGFDCSFSHAVLWPALLLGLGDYITPRHVISNEFYTLEGQKFSTSRGHAIWGADFLREADPDAVRFYLALTNPEQAKSDFQVAAYDRSTNALLAGELQDWTSSLFARLALDSAGTVPAADPSSWPAAVRDLVGSLPRTVGQALEPDSFSLRAAAGHLAAAIGTAAADLRRHQSVPSSPEETRAVLAGHAELLGVLSAVAAPIIPGWSAQVRRLLGLAPGVDGIPWPQAGQPTVPSGQKIASRFPVLFRARS